MTVVKHGGGEHKWSLSGLSGFTLTQREQQRERAGLSFVFDLKSRV